MSLLDTPPVQVPPAATLRFSLPTSVVQSVALRALVPSPDVSAGSRRKQLQQQQTGLARRLLPAGLPLTHPPRARARWLRNPHHARGMQRFLRGARGALGRELRELRTQRCVGRLRSAARSVRVALVVDHAGASLRVGRRHRGWGRCVPCITSRRAPAGWHRPRGRVCGGARRRPAAHRLRLRQGCSAQIPRLGRHSLCCGGGLACCGPGGPWHSLQLDGRVRRWRRAAAMAEGGRGRRE